MTKKSLKYLSKDELIEIIVSDKYLERQAFNKLNEIVHKKIVSIIDDQERCDLSTYEGHMNYARLEKEYKKWSKIQENLYAGEVEEYDK